MEIRGNPPSKEFRAFVTRYYLPFAENAIRYFFTLGFVPWRLRKICTGDVIPETIPLGLFTWSIESMPNRVSRQNRGSSMPARSSVIKAVSKSGPNTTADKHQAAAEMAFRKQKNYFSDRARVPYPLQGDVMRMPSRSDATDNAKRRRAEGFHAQQNTDGLKAAPGGPKDPRINVKGSATGDSEGSPLAETPAHHRQQAALQRQPHPSDDDDTKMLRYGISFTENCNVLDDEVEIYEFSSPTNSITRFSLLYGTVPTPLSHLLIDYRNIRTTQIRQAYADAYNTQAKLICTYNAPKNIYSVSEGTPILNGEGWAPQQRLGMHTDTNLPSEIESNAYTRDAVAETVIGSKSVEHSPVVYSLPKNTSVEPQQKLDSIIDVSKLQVVWALHFGPIFLCVR
jgi:hypothetical protein